MKFSREEKQMIATHDPKLYTTYRCSENGLYQIGIETDTGICPFCKKKHKAISDIEGLKTKFRKELKLPEE